jgi:hypothetical protein
MRKVTRIGFGLLSLQFVRKTLGHHKLGERLFEQKYRRAALQRGPIRLAQTEVRSEGGHHSGSATQERRERRRRREGRIEINDARQRHQAWPLKSGKQSRRKSGKF